MARRGENIYKRKDGRWEGRYKMGYDSYGKTKYRSVYARSYQEVKSKLSLLKNSSERCVSSGRVTVKEIFTEWLSAVKLKVKDSTYANYQMKADKHILPAFGSVTYDKLSAAMVHRFIRDKMQDGLSPKYVSDIIIVFKSMSKFAAREYGYHNPLNNVILPKSQKKEMQLFSYSQQNLLCKFLLNNLDNTKLCVLLSLYTGIRIGEVCALKWSDIDWEKSILTVRRTVQRISSKNEKGATKLLLDSPKSMNSLRSIPIPAFLLKLLKKMKGNPTAYVLSGTEKIIEPRTMQYRYQAILKKAQLPSIRFHSLRHMFATNCIALGFDVKTLSELLGHSSVQTTLNRYVHSSMDRKRECMNLITIAA